MKRKGPGGVGIHGWSPFRLVAGSGGFRPVWTPVIGTRGEGSTEIRKRGFVLLEAVVAMAILGVASIVLLQVRSQQIRVATQARELLTAQALAEDRLSALRLLDFEVLSDPPDSLMEGRFPAPFDAYVWTAEVELMEDEYDLFGLEVVVQGPAERFPLRTLVHRPRGLLVGAGQEGGGGAGAGGRSRGRGGPGGPGGPP